MKRKFSDASFGSMSHHQGTKGSWKDKNRKPLGKSHHQNRDKTASPYIVDNKPIPRVRKFLDGKTAADSTDTETIINYLQKVYPDYRRKKRISFRHSVTRALDIILQDFNASDEQTDEVDQVKEKRHRGLDIRCELLLK